MTPTLIWPTRRFYERKKCRSDFTIDLIDGALKMNVNGIIKSPRAEKWRISNLLLDYIVQIKYFIEPASVGFT